MYTVKVGAVEVFIRNDECCARQGHFIINGIPKANEKSKIPPIISQLLCQIDRPIISVNAEPSRGDQHNVFHIEDICPSQQV